VEYQEALKRRAVIFRKLAYKPGLKGGSLLHTGDTTDAVNNALNKRLADSIVTTGIYNALA